MALSLEIDITARIAKMQDALERIGRDAEKTGKRLETAFAGAGKALATIGVGLSAGAFAAFIKKSIDAQAHLADLSQKTGVAVETLGGLGFAAKLAGTDLEGVSDAFGRFNVNIAKAAAGNEEAGAAFKAMGLSVRDANGNIKTADRLLLEIADKFQRYADGPNKSALANALFGKSYASIIQLLNEGAAKIGKNSDYWKQFAHVNTESAEAAKELGDKLLKAQLHLEAMGNIVGNRLVGPLTQMAEAFTSLEESTKVLSSGAEGINKVFSVITVGAVSSAIVIEQVGKQLVAMYEVAKALGSLEFNQAKYLMEAAHDSHQKALKSLLEFNEKILHPERFQIVEPTKAKTGQKDAPGLPDKGKADEGLALQKKILDQRLHSMADWVAEESELLKARNSANEGYFSEGLLSVRHFFDLQSDAQADAIEKQRRAFAESEAALHDFIADPKVPAKDRVEAQTKLNDILAKGAKLEAEAAAKGTAGWFEQRKAVSALADAVTELNAQVLDNAGKTAEAAEVRRKSANRLLRQSLEQNAPGNIGQLDSLEASARAHDKFNDALSLSDKRLSELARAERQINNEQQSGALTTLDALERVDSARRQAVADLQAQLPLLREQARLSGQPVDIEAVAEAEQRLRDLAAASHQVSDQIRHAFEDALVTPFEDLVNHIKSADDAMRSFFNNIAQSLLHIASKKISEAIFGNLFSVGAGLFSGGGAGTVAAGNRMALGGVMTSEGPMKLERYASGGIASRPQLAMFGEGRMPEAYVPLPNGRSIPVTMSGQGGGTSVQAGPSAVVQAAPTIKVTNVLQLHPDAMHMRLSDWFDAEMARTLASR